MLDFGDQSLDRWAAMVAGDSGGGSSSLMGPGGNGCPTGWTKYTATRFGYANNGQAVTFVHDESWCAEASQSCAPSPQSKYAVAWAKEFAYDGARARYMDRSVNTTTLDKDLSLPTVWTDYDGDEAYGDYTVNGSMATDTDAYQPGLWRSLGGIKRYLHNDHLGTLLNTSNGAAFGDTPRVFTAFGERLSGAAATDRFGYVGAYGYQAHAEFPYLHVGYRYYDPGSGRFLQRDPIGVLGGVNVYRYAANAPTVRADPFGLWPMDGPPPSLVPVPGSPDDHRDDTQREFDNVVTGIFGVTGVFITGGAFVFSPAASAAGAGATQGLRWLNRGKFRIGISQHKGKPYFSVRWKRKHWDLFEVPDWMLDWWMGCV